MANPRKRKSAQRHGEGDCVNCRGTGVVRVATKGNANEMWECSGCEGTGRDTWGSVKESRVDLRDFGVDNVRLERGDL